MPAAEGPTPGAPHDADSEAPGARLDAGSDAPQPGVPLDAGTLVPGFQAETDLERRIAADPELLAGLAWGKPRRGHPEGTVGAHVADLLATIERWAETGERRAELRFLALVHDSMKYRVSNWILHMGENHHAVRARRFAERYTDDERLLATIELHDRPFNLWRRRFLRTNRAVEHAFASMVRRLPDIDMFVRFVELDGSTEGKNPAPLTWLKEKLAPAGMWRPSR